VACKGPHRAQADEPINVVFSLTEIYLTLAYVARRLAEALCASFSTGTPRDRRHAPRNRLAANATKPDARQRLMLAFEATSEEGFDYQKVLRNH